MYPVHNIAIKAQAESMENGGKPYDDIVETLKNNIKNEFNHKPSNGSNNRL
jgi:hypothetical protein